MNLVHPLDEVHQETIRLSTVQHQYVFTAYCCKSFEHFAGKCTLAENMSHAMAYLAGYGRRHFNGGAKIAWQKLKIVIYGFLSLYFASHATINCKAASPQRPFLVY